MVCYYVEDYTIFINQFRVRQEGFVSDVIDMPDPGDSILQCNQNSLMFLMY